jgi:hypothetical protein
VSAQKQYSRYLFRSQYAMLLCTGPQAAFAAEKSPPDTEKAHQALDFPGFDVIL